MSDFPTPWLVGIHRYVKGAVNPHNKPTKAYLPPKDDEGDQVWVIGWVPTMDGNTEPADGRLMSRLKLQVPPVLRNEEGDEVEPIGHMDLVDVPGHGQFEVRGEAEDYCHGFHGWQPGSIVNLERTVG